MGSNIFICDPFKLTKFWGSVWYLLIWRGSHMAIHSPHTHAANPLDNSTNLYPLLTHTSSWRQISQTTFKGSSVLFWIYFNPTLQVDWKLIKSHMHVCVCVCIRGSPPNQSMDNLLFRVQIKRGQNVPQKPRHSNPPLTLQFLWAVQTDITTDHQNWIDSIFSMP